ncbi:MAG: VWA domain-containing protein, partial [Anaerolineae bacterium]|nr:VWA domain-containing protein [Anaerolineae bacterium]
MRAKRILIALFVMSLLLWPVTGMSHALSSDEVNNSGIRINEVMPCPSPGQYAWVELYRPRAPFSLFLPTLLHGTGGLESTGFGSAAPEAQLLDISGWQISDEDGHAYTIPAALPPVPYNTFVLIHFDGQGPGADDYDFSDGVAVLHTPPGLVNIFDDEADQVALYASSEHTPSTIRDFVAYGGPSGEDASTAIAAGLWSPDRWVSLYIGSGAEAEGTRILDRSFGLYPGHSNQGPDDWAVYQDNDLSPGAANPVPHAYWATVTDGAVMGSDGFALGWALTPGAAYHLQMDDDPAFGSPVVDTILDEPRYAPDTPPPPGTYWWRVRSILGPGEASAWSTPARVTIIPVAEGDSSSSEGMRAVQQTVLPITWLRQRKDSPLLCLDGDNEGNPSAPSPKETWDAVHPDAIYVHGRNNCVRASIAMIVTNYGGNLSQDRLSYRLFENWGHPIEDRWSGVGLGEPAHDLGHDTPTFVCGGDGSSARTLLAWALGVNNSAIDYHGGKPSFAQIRNWIDNGRPVMRFHSGHQTVIGGYRVLNDGTQQIRLFDPWSGLTWQNYNSLDITCYYVAPASASNVRSDEPGIWHDADGDGIMDWDEVNRFHTDPTSPDTDADWVQDKQDIREYVFDNGGHYSLRSADIDGDGLRKELDADNDNDGSVDGCEDTNYNGKYEASLGETDNFNASSHQACVPRFDILQPTQANPTNAGAYNNPDKILIQVKTATPPSSPVTYTPADFDVKIGGQTGTVIAVYRVFDTHFLVVSPPTQSSADYYDLQVTLQSTQSDTETRAVYYLPQLRADQMLIIDRSGSMSSYGKMDAAKNAARAFIDHANVGDMIGVASFASSASVNYSLATITGSTEWNAAKAAVNGLSAGGTTALGQGAQTGYNQITSKGQSDHDWAMVLLSDGMENVTPYWSDSSVSGVIVPSRVVVHTVALGRDADEMLLASIAGQTGGTFYEAGTDILPSSASGTGSGSTPEAMPGPNLSNTLPNRLADVYKGVG